MRIVSVYFFALFFGNNKKKKKMDVELNAPESFIHCNNEKCSSVFKYLDLSVHTIVDGPDPRDHLANERNLLTWIRTGTTLSLVGELCVYGAVTDILTIYVKNRLYDTARYANKEFCTFLFFALDKRACFIECKDRVIYICRARIHMFHLFAV